MNRPPELPPALEAERKTIVRRAGMVSYYVAGQGAAILLVHSINAAASAYEMRPLFEHLRSRFTVYALDLPGFGFSDRSERDYSVRLYVDAIADMLQVIKDDAGDAPLHVAALSLSCELVARAIVEQPHRFHSAAFITPTGFNRGSDRLREPGETREVPHLLNLLQVRLWSRGLFDLLTKKGTIRYFLRRTYGSTAIDQSMVEYDYLTARQQGAEHAPLAFLSGRLFSKDVRALYERLELPIWATRATRGDFSDFSESAWTRTRDNWRFETFEAGAMPHFEVPDEYFPAYDRFLAELEA